MIIGISGYKGCGKDTAAQFICNKYHYTIYHFADPIKKHCAEIFNLDIEMLKGNFNRELREDIFAGRFNKSPRILMQIYGTVLRNEIDPNIWVEYARHHITRTNTVIADVRFHNEIEYIEQEGGHVIRIIRDECEGDDHESEQELNKYKFKHIIENNGTIKDLEHKIDKLVDLLLTNKMIGESNEKNDNRLRM